VSWSINQSDVVTAVSESLKRDTYSHFHVNRDIEVVPNFIDFDRFSKKPKDHFKKAISPNGEKVLIHTSNFRKVKRVGDVLQVFRKVLDQMPARLLLIGDGPERSHIENLCRDLQTCDQVSFLGKQEAIEEILSIADLFLLPSQTESFGLAALEAMACEVPVISSNAGGLPEVNIEGKTGFLAEVGDIDRMAEKALYLLQNEEVLKQFRVNALAQAQRFDLDSVLKQYVALYEKALA